MIHPDYYRVQDLQVSESDVFFWEMFQLSHLQFMDTSYGEPGEIARK